MAVDSVAGVGTTTTASTTSVSGSDAAKTSLDYNNFLTLLIAQMKHQDPTDPMDATEQISQLATFSQVEQSIKTNAHLESLITLNSLSGAASWIGKTVTSLDGQTTGVVESVRVTADGIVATTTAGAQISIGEGVTISETAGENA